MKILHVIPYAHSMYGGPSVAVRNMAIAMQQKGNEVHIVTTNAAGIYDLQFENNFISVEEGVQIHYFKRSFPSRWFYAKIMKKWLNENAQSYDLIHLHIPFTAPFRYGAKAAWYAKRPYVVSTHGLLDSWSLQQKTWKKLPYLFLLENTNIRRASAIHVTSSLEAKFVKSMNLGPQVFYMPLAVSNVLNKGSYSDFSNENRILCIARLHPVKAIPVLFKTLIKIREKRRDIILDLAGDGDTEYVQQLKIYARKLGIDKAIVWHGHIGETKKLELYSKAKCFILLSYHENFGLAVAEALAAGVPAVISDQVGLAPDLITYEAGKVVPVDDAEATANAVENMLSSKLYMQYRHNARKLAAQRYNQKNYANELSSLYSSIIDSFDINK